MLRRIFVDAYLGAAAVCAVYLAMEAAKEIAVNVSRMRIIYEAEKTCCDAMKKIKNEYIGNVIGKMKGEKAN